MTREEERLVKKKRVTGIVAVVAAVLVVIIGIMLCTVKVPAGYAAVCYSMNGGVSGKTYGQCWHFKNPTVKTTKYTVGIEQSYLTADKKGDSPKDESFSASSSEGKALTVDLTYTYKFERKNVCKVFTEFKGLNGDDVRDTFIKPNIISWSKEVICKYEVSDIIGSKRDEVNKALTKSLAARFEPYGISISNVSMIDVSVDKKTMKVINDKIAAQQDAETQAIKNKTNIDKAKADAEVKKTQAQADADAKVIEAKAEADANKKLNSSITENLIKMKEAEARYKHGWVTVKGADTVVTDAKEK